MDTRYKIVFACVGVVVLIIIMRIYYLSIISFEYYSSQAARNIFRMENLLPARGQILDRNNKPLAINSLGYNITLSPYLGKKDKLGILNSEIAKIVRYVPHLDFDTLKEEYLSKYSPYNHNNIVIARFVPYDDMYKAYSILIQSDYIHIDNATRRNYPNSTIASHVVGYIGAANASDIENSEVVRLSGVIGKSGLEKYYNDFLQGELGYIKTKVDAFNRVVEVIDEQKATTRHDIVLGLDIELQKAMDKEFIDKSGAAIVMDAHSGEILAAGSYPEYNLNTFVDGMSKEQWSEIVDDVNNPLLNKLINGTYPPGSIVKMGVGMAFLEYADIDEHSVIDTPAYIEIGGRQFRDWKAEGHGSADLIKAIRRSVDVYFYKLSQRVGDEKMAKTLQTMGFGELSGVDLPFETRGILPTKEWKLVNRGEPWLVGDTIITSIGQGLFLATPMQIARYTALLATGFLPTPHFAIKLGDEDVYLEPADVLNDFQKSKLSALQLGMYQVCNKEDGTAYYATRGSPITLACKTGTAQVVGIPQNIASRIPESQMEYFHRSHSWITAYLPYKNPKYVITILVEHGGSAGRATGKILTNLSKKLHELGYVKE